MDTSDPDQVESAKIVATIGPASASVDTLRAMIRAGTRCFRVNFSHGDGASLEPLMVRARQAEHAEGRPIALMADIQGPKLRIGAMPEGGAMLHEGARFVLTPSEISGSASRVQTRYPDLARDVEPGARVLLSDGTIELEVESIEGQDVHCRVVAGGRLYSNKGMNLPGRPLSTETLTDKDRRDLAYLSRSDVDLIAISFVRSADDLRSARQVLGDERQIPLVAKLERGEALDELEPILEASDGIMVARGDLGVELPFERVPMIQKRILSSAAQRGKWAIVATQMLGSMVRANRPTRAEASDVLNAVLDGADAVMLSEETAVGEHPVAAVRAMHALVGAAKALTTGAGQLESSQGDLGFAAGAAGAAVAAAERVDARAIVTLAGSGATALLVSKRRPRLPTLALSSTRSTLRRLNLLRGVRPVPIERHADVEAQLVAADRFLLSAGIAATGEVVVVVAAIPLGRGKETNTIRLHRVRATEGSG